MSPRKRRLTDGELSDLLELVKMRLQLLMDGTVDLAEGSEQLYQACSRIHGIRQEMARRDKRKKKAKEKLAS